jgi:hypothetical protein
VNNCGRPDRFRDLPGIRSGRTDLTGERFLQPQTSSAPDGIASPGCLVSMPEPVSKAVSGCCGHKSPDWRSMNSVHSGIDITPQEAGTPPLDGFGEEIASCAHSLWRWRTASHSVPSCCALTEFRNKIRAAPHGVALMQSWPFLPSARRQEGQVIPRAKRGRVRPRSGVPAERLLLALRTLAELDVDEAGARRLH